MLVILTSKLGQPTNRYSPRMCRSTKPSKAGLLARDAITRWGCRLASAVVLSCITLASGPIAAQDVRFAFEHDEAAWQQAAWQAWKALPSKDDSRVIDHFIGAYPTTEAGQVALALRHSLLRAETNLDEYYRFIETYHGTYVAEQTRHELFAKLLERDSLADYAEFVRRFPASPLSQVAMLHVADRAFRVAHAEGTIEAYEGFVLGFPHSAQVQRALIEASLLYKGAEKAKRDAIESNLDLTNEQQLAECRKRANELVVEWFRAFESFQLTWGVTVGQLANMNDEGMRLHVADAISEFATDGALLLEMHRVKRLRDCILDVYADLEVAAQLAMHGATLIVLEGISTAITTLTDQLDKQHKDLLEAVKLEFVLTRNAIADGFEDLADKIDGVSELLNDRLTVISDDLKIVHGKLEVTNKTLNDIYCRQGSIIEAINETAQKLDILDASVVAVGNKITQLNKDLSGKLDVLGTKLDGLHKEIKCGFERTGKAIEELGSKSEFDTMVSLGRAGLFPYLVPSQQRLEHWGGMAKDNWRKVEESPVGRALGGLASLLGGHILGFEFETSAHFSLNRLQNTADILVRLPGSRLDAEALVEFERPALDAEGLLEMAANTYGLRVEVESGYLSERDMALQEHPGCSVYVSSQRFVDWASSETVATYLIEFLMSGGASWEQMLNESKEKLILELNDIAVFLYQEGIPAPQVVATRVMNAIIDQSSLPADAGAVSISIRKVPYKYRVRLAGKSKLPLRTVEQALGSNVNLHISDELRKAVEKGVVITLQHVMVVIAIETELPISSANTKALLLFRDRETPEGLPDTRQLIGELAEHEESRFASLIDGFAVNDFLHRYGDEFPAGRLQQILNDTIAKHLHDVESEPLDLQNHSASFRLDGRTIDFRSRETESRIEGLLRELGLVWGNESTIKLVRAEVDLPSQRCELHVVIRNRHVWNLRDLPGQLAKIFQELKLL